MKRYCIKSQPGKTTYFDILGENEEGYKIRITRIADGDERIQEEYIERQLFDTCLATGYVAELNDPGLACSAA